MMDGLTDLMHRTADPIPIGPIPFGGSPPHGFTPGHAQARPARDRAGVGPSLDQAWRYAVGPIGRLVAEGFDARLVRELVELLQHRHAADRIDWWVDGQLARGLPVEHIYLRLFQPAARRLGELWADDICSFVDVTLATALLHSDMRRLAPRFQQHGRSPDATRSVFLATLGDDQHTFGLAMTAEFFRRGGWTVCIADAGDLGSLVSRFQDQHGAVVGLSASRADQLPELATVIRQLRRIGGDRIAGILVGGPLFVMRPECARDVGADAVGLDARQALAEAESLVAAGDRWR